MRSSISSPSSPLLDTYLRGLAAVVGLAAALWMVTPTRFATTPVAAQATTQIVQITNLTAGQLPGLLEGGTLSYDGARVAYALSHESGQDYRLYTAPASGQGSSVQVSTGLVYSHRAGPARPREFGHLMTFIACDPATTRWGDLWCGYSNLYIPGDLYVAAAGGGAPQRLTFDGQPGVYSGSYYHSSTISRDGTHVAVGRFLEWERDHLIVMNADGTNSRELTISDSSLAGFSILSFSPDGSEVAWFSGSAKVAAAKIDGSGFRILRDLAPAGSTFYGFHALSGDWRYLLLPNPSGTGGLSVVSVDGTYSSVVDSQGGGYPTISFDGSVVCYQRGVAYLQDDVYCANADGTNQRNITHVPTGAVAPDGAAITASLPHVSDDGTKVAFWSNADLDPGKNTDHSWEIFVAPLGPSLAPDRYTAEQGQTITFSGMGYTAGSPVTLSVTGPGGTTLHSTNAVDRGLLTWLLPTSCSTTVGSYQVFATDEVTQQVSPTVTVNVSASSSCSAAVTVASIAPTSGPTGGGTLVSVTGTNFAAGATLTIGTAATGVQVNTGGTTITGTTAAYAVAGPVDVVVTNPDGRSGVLPGGFTYVVPGNLPPVAFIRMCSGGTCKGNGETLTVSVATGATAPVDFSAVNSSDPDGVLVSYRWVIGSATFTERDVAVSVPEGTYDVLLTVTDNGGAEGTATARLVVQGPSVVAVDIKEPPIYGERNSITKMAQLGSGLNELLGEELQEFDNRFIGNAAVQDCYMNTLPAARLVGLQTGKEYVAMLAGAMADSAFGLLTTGTPLGDVLLRFALSLLVSTAIESQETNEALGEAVLSETVGFTLAKSTNDFLSGQTGFVVKKSLTDSILKLLDANEVLNYSDRRTAGGAIADVDITYSKQTRWVTVVMGSSCVPGRYLLQYPVNKLGGVYGGVGSEWVKLLYCDPTGTCIQGR